jgi:post-segregation antitoxin (ccd killing protein)
MQIYDVGATKCSVNLMLTSDLVARAQAQGLDLSAVVEAAIAAEVVRNAGTLCGVGDWRPRYGRFALASDM